MVRTGTSCFITVGNGLWTWNSHTYLELPARLSSAMPKRSRLEVKGDSDTAVARHLGRVLLLLWHAHIPTGLSSVPPWEHTPLPPPPCLMCTWDRGFYSVIASLSTSSLAAAGPRDASPLPQSCQESQIDFQDKNFTAFVHKHGNTFGMTRQKWTNIDWGKSVLCPMFNLQHTYILLLIINLIAHYFCFFH